LSQKLPEDISQLAEIVGAGKGHNPFLARVWKKSKIRYFGKTTEDKQYPMFYSLLITDKSTPKGIPVTVWNDLALHTYSELDIGDVIQVNNYRVKKFYDSGVFTAKFKNEISINASSNQVVMQKLIKKDMQDVKDFSPISFPLSNVKQILEMDSEDAIVNVLGVIVNTGCYRREKFESQYSQYRYLTLVDSSTDQMISVKMYTNSRKNELDLVEVGSVVLLTDLRVKQFVTSIEKTERYTCVESTFVSSIFIGERLERPSFKLLSGDEDIAETFAKITRWKKKNINGLKRFVKHASTMNHLDTYIVGPNRQYPLPEFNDLESYKKAYPSISWIYFKQLFELPSSLGIKESQTVIVKLVVKDINIQSGQKRKHLSREDISRKKGVSSVNNPTQFEEATERGYTFVTIEVESVNGDTRLEILNPIWNCEFSHPAFSPPSHIDVLDEHLELLLQVESTEGEFVDIESLLSHYRKKIQNHTYICALEVVCVGFLECKYYVSHMFADG